MHRAKKKETRLRSSQSRNGQAAAVISSSPPLPFPPRPWHAGICALYRRICILRLRGNVDEAERLAADDWPRALADLRQSVPNADQALAPILAAEAERMATAEAVVDLLGPSATPSLAVAAAPAPRPAELKSEARSRPLVPKGIADFIDEMLADNRARPSGAGH